jgi:hypothetical protein
MGLLLLLSLFLIGRLIKKSMNFETISISIIFYLFSIFFIDQLFLLSSFHLSFHHAYLVTNSFWIIFFLYAKNIKSMVFVSISFLSSGIIFRAIERSLTKNLNITGDVDAVFYQQVKQIYENSYYFSINNYVMEGYPQFLSYFQALFLKFVNFNQSYEFYSFTSHIVFYLTLLYFFELKIDVFNKVILVVTYFFLIFNSEWLQFLISSSLMSEGLVNLFAVVCLTELLTTVETKRNDYRIYFVFGMLYLSKQFLSSIVIIVVIVLFVKHRKKIILFIGLLGFILKELLYLFTFQGVSKDHHIRQIDVKDTLIDLVTFRDLELQNIVLILKNVFLDKPFTLLLILVYLLFAISKIIFNDKNIISDYIFYTLSLNAMFVFVLYISAWRFMELDSPVRYLLNFLSLMFVYIFLTIEKVKT